MFIVSLAIFTIILTVFENIFLALMILGAIIVLFLVVKIWEKDSKNIGWKICVIILAFVMSLCAILLKNYRYLKKISTISGDDGVITADVDGVQGSYFVGTGIISDIYSYQKYIFQDKSGREYFLKSDREYVIGDTVRLNGYVQLGYTGVDYIFKWSDQWKDLKQGSIKSDVFHYEFDFPKWEMMKGYFGTIYAQKAIVIADSEENISYVQKIRKSLQKSIIHSYGKTPQAGLVLGMLIGDRSQIPRKEYQGFINSGLVHIIAVSGGNIVMIVIFLSALLFFLPFYIRNGVILLTIIGYAMVCGLDSSVLRATIMGGLSMLALFWGREIDIWRAMGTAFVIMVLVNPYFFTYDVGFLLSFSAIIGIIYFSEFLDKCIAKKKGKGTKLGNFGGRILKEYISPTIGATLGVLPIMLFFMGGTNLLGIVANFVIVPIIAIVMIYGFISTILYGILPRNRLLRPEKKLINYIYAVSDLTEKYGIYLQANGDRIKRILLILFILWLVAKVGKRGGYGGAHH